MNGAGNASCRAVPATGAPRVVPDAIRGLHATPDATAAAREPGSHAMGPVHLGWWRVTMAMDRDDVISVLNDLVETSEDGLKVFRTCADGVTNSERSAPRELRGPIPHP
jgi:hypothetical protein